MDMSTWPLLPERWRDGHGCDGCCRQEPTEEELSQDYHDAFRSAVQIRISLDVLTLQWAEARSKVESAKTAWLAHPSFRP